MELERRLLEMYADPALDTKPALLNDRGGAFYSEAAAAAARVAARRRRRRPGRRRPQRRCDRGPPPDDVVEVPARIDREGAHPLAQGPMDRGDARRWSRRRRSTSASPSAPRCPATARTRGWRSRRTRWSAPGSATWRRCSTRCSRRTGRTCRASPQSVSAPAPAARGCVARSGRSPRRSSGSLPTPPRAERGRRCGPPRAPELDDDRRPRHLGSRGDLRAVPDRDAPRPADRAGQAIGHDRLRRAAWPGRDGLLLAISQSGQSPDIVAVVRAAREAGALTVAITNDARSPLAAAAEWQLRCHAGRELAVPATKTYVAELAVVASLVAAIRPSSDLADGLAAAAGRAARHAVADRAWLDGPGRMAMEDLAGGRPRAARLAGLQPGDGAGARAEAQGDVRPLRRGVLDRRLRARPDGAGPAAAYRPSAFGPTAPWAPWWTRRLQSRWRGGRLRP